MPNLIRAIGAVALTVVYVGWSLVRLRFGADPATIFPGPIRRYCLVTLRWLGVTLEVEGNLNRPGLMMANHGSLLDVFIFGALCEQPTTFVVKKELERAPLVGSLLTACGHVLLDRDHAVRAMRELRRVSAVLAEGGRALIFPEGTRQPDGVLGPFRPGPFVIAARAKVPIIPIAVVGAAALLPKNLFAFRPGVIRVVVLDPIDTKDWSDDTSELHAEQVRAAIAAGLTAARAKSLPFASRPTARSAGSAEPPAHRARTSSSGGR